MAGFGQGINPSLGAANFTPFLAGAQQGAAHQARGIEQLGASIAGGLQNYYQKQEEKKMNETATAAVAKFIEDNPSMAKRIRLKDPNDKGALKEIVKSMGGAAPTLSVLNQLSQMQDMARDERQIQIGLAARAHGKMDPLRAIQASEGSVSPAVAQFFSNLAHQEAQTANLNAEAAARGVPKAQDLSFQEQNVAARIDAFKATNKRAPNEQEKAAIYADVARASSPAGDPELNARLDILKKELPVARERADTAMRLLPNVRSLQKKLKDGLNTGKLEPLKTSVKAIASSLGLPVDAEELGNAEAAQAMFTQFMMEFIAATKGAITERENDLFRSMGPELSKSPKANEDLIKIVDERLKFDVRLGDVYSSELSKGTPLGEIAAKLQKEREKYNESYEAALSKLEEKYQTVSRAPAVGNVIDGYEFLGGDPSQQASWRKVK